MTEEYYGRMFDILNFAAGRLYGEKDTEKEKPQNGKKSGFCGSARVSAFAKRELPNLLNIWQNCRGLMILNVSAWLRLPLPNWIPSQPEGRNAFTQGKEGASVFLS